MRLWISRLLFGFLVSASFASELRAAPDGPRYGLALGAPSRAAESDVALAPRSLFELTVLGKRRGVLSVADDLTLLTRYRTPWRSGDPAWRVSWAGAYGIASFFGSENPLQWDLASCEAEPPAPSAPWQRFMPEWLPNWNANSVGTGAGFAELDDTFFDFVLASAAPLASPADAAPLCPRFKQPKPVSIARTDGEWDRFVLLDCDASIPPDALDRLSVLARPGATPRPELPLPIEPQSQDGEWLPQIKLLHPRLFWVLQRIADAFPARVIELYSGYRKDKTDSLHHRGRALDLAVRGVPNEELLALCRKLNDVGCGYYPNNYFVHVDIRDYGSHHPFWVDTSGPGEPSRYVDSRTQSIPTLP